MSTKPERLEEVRVLERRRIQATRANDVDALAPLLHEDLIYVNSVGQIYDKPTYLGAIRTHALTYDVDFDVRETDCRVFDDLVVLAGVMLGHSRLEGEQQVFRFRCISVWRNDANAWRMVAWQSSSASDAGLDVVRSARISRPGTRRGKVASNSVPPSRGRQRLDRSNSTAAPGTRRMR